MKKYNFKQFPRPYERGDNIICIIIIIRHLDVSILSTPFKSPTIGKGSFTVFSRANTKEFWSHNSDWLRQRHVTPAYIVDNPSAVIATLNNNNIIIIILYYTTRSVIMQRRRKNTLFALLSFCILIILCYSNGRNEWWWHRIENYFKIKSWFYNNIIINVYRDAVYIVSS